METEKIKEVLDVLPIVANKGEDVTKANLLYTNNVVKDILRKRSWKVAIVTSLAAAVLVGASMTIKKIFIIKQQKKEA